MYKALEAAKQIAAAEKEKETEKEQIFAAPREWAQTYLKRLKAQDITAETADAVRTLDGKVLQAIDQRDREQHFELSELVRIVAEAYHLEKNEDGVIWTAAAAGFLAHLLNKYDADELDAATAAQLRKRALTHRAARWVRGEVESLNEAQLIAPNVPLFNREKVSLTDSTILAHTADHTAVLEAAQILAVTAKSGQGKSQLVNLITGALLGYTNRFFASSNHVFGKRVLLIDTEQTDRQILRRCTVLEQLGVPLDCLDIVALADYSVERRKAYLYSLIEQQNTQYSAIIFDGLKDFVTDFNDNAVCYELVSILTAWAKLTNTAVVCCLHLNKGAQGGGLMGAAKGHIGAALTEKASVVYVLEKKQISGTEVFTATLEKNRNGRTGEEVSLKWTYDGEQYTPYAEEESETKIERVFDLSVLESVLHRGELYKKTEVCSLLGCSSSDFDKFVSNGWLKLGGRLKFSLI